jgi:hypothetical protein
MMLQTSMVSGQSRGKKKLSHPLRIPTYFPNFLHAHSSSPTHSYLPFSQFRLILSLQQFSHSLYTDQHYSKKKQKEDQRHIITLTQVAFCDSNTIPLLSLNSLVFRFAASLLRSFPSPLTLRHYHRS